MNTGHNSKQTTCLCRDTGGKTTLLAQCISFNTLDNWGHKIPTQSKKRKDDRKEKVKGSWPWTQTMHCYIELSFCILIKGITPKIHMLCFVLINSFFLFSLFSVLTFNIFGSCFRMLAVILILDILFCKHFFKWKDLSALPVFIVLFFHTLYPCPENQ